MGRHCHWCRRQASIVPFLTPYVHLESGHSSRRETTNLGVPPGHRSKAFGRSCKNEDDSHPRGAKDTNPDLGY